jgi:hypothetical protein
MKRLEMRKSFSRKMAWLHHIFVPWWHRSFDLLSGRESQLHIKNAGQERKEIGYRE